MHTGNLAMSGALGLKKITRPRPGLRTYFLDRVQKSATDTGRLLDKMQQLYQRLDRPDQFANEIADLEHRLRIPTLLNDVRPEDEALVLRGAYKVLTARLLARLSGVMVLDSRLHLGVIRGGRLTPLGIASVRVITTAGVNFLTDAFQNLTEIDLFHFHAIGTGTNAEAVGDTALQTELSTEYTGNQRANGTQTEGSANVYVTVGTNTLDSGTPAVTEHGIMSQQATGGGTLWDRSVFSAINLVGANGDGLQSTYSLTSSSGG